MDITAEMICGPVGLAVVATMALVLICWHIRRYGAVAAVNKENDSEIEDDKLPPVSVIVYTSDDTENLCRTLPMFMSQNYPKYQVILVDDSFEEHTKDYMLEASVIYPELHYTYIPRGTSNLSRRKLSLTLGIKAAKYDYVLTTASNCYPSGADWLRTMMRNFKPGIEVVIGNSHIQSGIDNEKGCNYRNYDRVVGAVQYLASAIHGVPYRGDGNNLAYRKDLFFARKGFSQSLNLHYGDDDMFVDEITNGDNTAVELSELGRVTTRYENPVRAYRDDKLRYGFTMRYLSTFSKYSTALISTLRYVFVAAVVAVVCAAGYNWLPIVVALLLLVAEWGVEIVMFRKSATVVGGRKLRFSIPVFALYRPLDNFRYKMLNIKLRRANFTSRRKKIV